MQLLLRKISPDGSGFQEYVDTEIDAGEVLLGSSPQCDIQLLGEGIAAIHARFKQRGGEIRLLAEKGCTFSRNGAQTKEAAIGEGDIIDIGGQVFTCTAAPAGFELALEWQPLEVPGHLLANAYRTSIDQLKFSSRKLSWLLALAILVAAGIGPALSYYFMQSDQPDTVQQGVTLDSLWLSGPLLDAHQVAIGNNCAACHESAFVQVRDRACTECHNTMTDHVAVDHPAVAEFSGFACQNCHKEHNEPQHIVAAADRLCLDCHADMEPAVAGFSLDNHPAFAATLLQPTVERINGAIAVHWQQSKASLAEPPRETNHLKYPHDVHMDPQAVSHPQRGDGLTCVDCHTLRADREHFEPIAMEQHCADCHDLSFDLRNPQQQLPHGAPAEVYSALEAHYVKLAFNPELGSTFERRRLPAREWEDERCEQDYACAQQQALREAEQQFLQRGCVNCHDVSTLDKAQRGEQWEVLPVKLNRDWYADARFDHQSHLTQAELSGDALCLTCHQASTSSASEDILLPTLEQCTDCHGDKSVRDRVPLNCIACHDYHRHGNSSFQPVDLNAALESLGENNYEGAIDESQ